jgi:hypothetical protein
VSCPLNICDGSGKVVFEGKGNDAAMVLGGSVRCVCDYPCDECDEDKVEEECAECGDFFCESCLTDHLCEKP